MDWIKTNQCCCGFSLRGGTIFIMVLGLVFIIPSLITIIRENVPFYTAVITIAIAAVEIFGLYGVHQREASFLFPNVIYRVLLVFLVGIGMIIVIAGMFLKSHRVEMVTSDAPYVFLVGMIIVFGIFFHFMQVVYSYYSELNGY